MPEPNHADKKADLIAPTLRKEAGFGVEEALRAVLLFHSPGSWGAEKSSEWYRLVHDERATTKVLCDVVREALEALSHGSPNTSSGLPCSSCRNLLDPERDTLTCADCAFNERE